MIITIREAKEEDYEQLMKLYGHFEGDEKRFAGHDNDGFRKVMESSASFLYVAEESGKLVGLITFSVRDVVRYPKPIMEIDELFVGVSYRKHGVGRRLVEQAEEKARDLNCQNIYLETYLDNEPAQGLYEKMGYKKYGYAFKKVL